MEQNSERARALAHLPLAVGRLAVHTTLWGRRQTGHLARRALAVIRGLTVGDNYLVERLAATLPLNEAKLGADDVARGLKLGDRELTGLGRRQIARAVVSAERSPEVPDEVTSAVVHIAQRSPVDPLAASTVRPELAEEAREVILKFGRDESRLPRQREELQEESHTD